MFQALWKLNDPMVPIGLHHGSLEIEQRRKVEAAMADGRLRAVVATSSLDLGIDWGGIDQVIQATGVRPKGISRLLQRRFGRANHRMDEASRAILVPANRFEVLECEAAIQGIAAKELDGDPPRPGGLDVLAQHLLGLACAAPFKPDDVYAEVRTAAPYADLARQDFDDVLRFVENGGYALEAYDQWRKLFRDSQGFFHVRSAQVALRHRMNIGTIVEAPLLKVRLTGKRGGFGVVLGELEEYFAGLLRPGDTFMFAGRLLRFTRIREMAVECMEGGGGEPMVPAYEGGRLPLTTNLADRGTQSAAHAGRVGYVSRTGARMVANATRCVAVAWSERSACGNISARRPLVPRRLLLRRPQCPSNAWHAADETNGARGDGAAWLCRHRLCDRYLVGQPSLRRRAAVRSGHAWRRP